jgi:hypothetical protein
MDYMIAAMDQPQKAQMKSEINECILNSSFVPFMPFRG